MQEAQTTPDEVPLDSVDLDAKVEEVFQQYTSGTFLFQKEMVDLLGDLHIQCTIEQLQSNFPEEKYDLDTAKEITMHFNSIMNAASATQKINSAHVVNIGPLEYLWLKMRCKTRKKFDYQINWPSIDCETRPRTRLLAGTAVVMFVTGMLVIMSIAIFWVSTEVEREKRIAGVLGHGVGSFASLFEHNWMKSSGLMLASSANSVNLYQRGALRGRNEHLGSKLLDLASLGAVATSTDTTKVLDEHHKYVSKALQSLPMLANKLRLRTSDPLVILSILASLENSKEHDFDFVVLNISSAQLVMEPKKGCSGAFSCAVQANDCLGTVQDNTVRGPFITSDLYLETSFAYSVGIPAWNVSVCAFLSQSFVREAAIGVALHDHSVVVEDHFEAHHLDFNLVQIEGSNTQNGTLTSGKDTTLKWVTNSVTIPPDPKCIASACSTVDAFALSALLSRHAAVSLNTVATSGNTAICAIYPTNYNYAVILCEDSSVSNPVHVSALVSTVNAISKTTHGAEIILFSHDPITLAVSDQLNDVQRPSECFQSNCARVSLAKQNAVRSFDTKSTGYAITPNYRLKPVMGGYSYFPELDLAFVSEVDVLSIREEASKNLVEIIDEINHVINGLEIVALRAKGVLPTYTFLSSDPCPQGETCVMDAQSRIVLRSDCLHCHPVDTHEIFGVTRLTQLRDVGRCEGNCSDGYLSSLALYQHAVRKSYKDDVSIDTGYTGENVLAATNFALNISMGTVVEWPTQSYLSVITKFVGISVGVAVLFVALALLLLMVQSRKSLNSIEDQWEYFKVQINEETEHFATLVMEVLPVRFAETLLSTNEQISETVPLVVSTINFSAFHKTIATYDGASLTRYLSYAFYLITTTCAHYDLHKVRTIGDIVLIVGGLDINSRDSDAFRDVTEKTMSAMAVISQLFGFHFLHSPNSVSCMKRLATTPNTTTITDLPLLRIGVHSGPCQLYVLRTSGAAIFDVHGMNVAIAFKLQSSAKPGTIHISQQIRDTLDRGCFTADYKIGTKRSLVYKKVMIEASTVSAAQIDIPRSIMSALGIKRSHPRLYFLDSGVSYDTPGHAGQQGTVDGSVTGSQLGESNRSSTFPSRST